MALLGPTYGYGRKSVFLFLLFLVFGLYLINSGLSFVTMPSFILGIDKWIVLFSGVLLIIGGFMYYMRRSY